MMMGRPMSEGMTISVGAKLLTLTKLKGVLPHSSLFMLLGFLMALLIFSMVGSIW